MSLLVKICFFPVMNNGEANWLEHFYWENTKLDIHAACVPAYPQRGFHTIASDRASTSCQVCRPRRESYMHSAVLCPYPPSVLVPDPSYSSSDLIMPVVSHPTNTPFKLLKFPQTLITWFCLTDIPESSITEGRLCIPCLRRLVYYCTARELPYIFTH